MKKLLSVLIIIAFFSIIVYYSDQKEEILFTNLDNEEELQEIYESQENNISSNNNETGYIEVGEVHEFVRTASRYDTQKIVVKGLFWGYSVISLDNASSITLEYPNQQFEDTCMSNIAIYARSDIYGTYDAKTGTIMVDDISYINPITSDQKFWNNTILIQSSTLSQYRDFGNPLESTEFEATVTRGEDINSTYVLSVVGTSYKFMTFNSPHMEQFKTYQILFNNLHYDQAYDCFRADIIEVVALD